MESSQSTPTRFRSKKPFTPVSKGNKASGEAALSTKTPENKPPQPPAINPNRARNRGVALSVADVRKMAESLRQSKPDTSSSDANSARKRIFSWESPVKKPKRSDDDKLPEKYEVLNRFFCNLDASLKLLRMRASVPTFSVLSKQIECLSDRRFTYRHLSQLKHVLPEVIEIKKDNVVDDKTGCMKPDLRITFNSEAAGKAWMSGSESGPVDLRKLFYARLNDFIRNHPEGDDIPEDPLPPPFNHTEQSKYLNETPSKISSSLPPRMPIEGQSVVRAGGASHLSTSFQRRFSKRNTKDVSTKDSVEGNLEKTNASADVDIMKNSETSSCHSFTPIKQANLFKNELTPVRTPCVESTPAKLASTPAGIMASTPTLQPPSKRSCSSPEDGPISTPNKLLRRLPRNRSLKFDSPMKGGSEAECASDDDATCSDGVVDILSDDLVQSIREKERIAMLEKDPAISQAKRRREIIAGLPKLLNLVYYLFQSSKRNVITREELICKIVTSRFEMIDRRDVEEELDMLKELAPEWISEKVASSGDVLLRVDKGLDLSIIRAQLAEAN